MLDLAGGTHSSLRYARSWTRDTRQDLPAEERWGKTRGERRQPLLVQESLLQQTASAREPEERDLSDPRREEKWERSLNLN